MSVTLKPTMVSQPVTPYTHVWGRCREQAQQAGDNDTAASYYHQAENIYQQLSDNCLVID